MQPHLKVHAEEAWATLEARCCCVALCNRRYSIHPTAFFSEGLLRLKDTASTSSRSGSEPPQGPRFQEWLPAPSAPIVCSRQHMSRHCRREPSAPAALSAHPHQGDNGQHTLRKEATGIRTKNSPYTKNIKATQGWPHI